MPLRGLWIEHRQALEALGWVVQLDQEAISLHRRWTRGAKLGEPLQHKDLVLYYVPRKWIDDEYDLIDRQTGEIFAPYWRAEERPWRVHDHTRQENGKGTKNRGRAYEDLDVALEAFMDLAAFYAPVHAS